MNVQEIMTTNVRSCLPATNLAEVTRLMWEADCGIVPVVNERGEVLGTVTDRDVCIALGTRNRRASSVHASEVMSAPAYVCSPNDSVTSALAVMQAHRVRRLPVVGIGGVLLGMISLNDIVLHVPVPKRDALFQALHSVCEHTREPKGIAVEVAG